MSPGVESWRMLIIVIILVIKYGQEREYWGVVPSREEREGGGAEPLRHEIGLQLHEEAITGSCQRIIVGHFAQAA